MTSATPRWSFPFFPWRQFSSRSRRGGASGEEEVNEPSSSVQVGRFSGSVLPYAVRAPAL